MTYPECFSISNKVDGRLFIQARDVSITIHGKDFAYLNADEARWLGDVMHAFADILDGKKPVEFGAERQP